MDNSNKNNKRKAEDKNNNDATVSVEVAPEVPPPTAVTTKKKRATESTSATATATATTIATTIDTVSTSPTKEATIPPKATTKPILVVLPGASGKLSNDMTTYLIPELQQIFEVRIREEKKWSGWDPIKNAKEVVASGICSPTTDNDDDDQSLSPWFIMGASYGNRVATSIVAEKLFVSSSSSMSKDTPLGAPIPAPGLILTGYPMYGPSPKQKEIRVEQLQKLPKHINVLALSGEKDDYLCSSKNLPMNVPTQNSQALWDLVVEGMACQSTTTIHLIPKGGHGVYPSAKGLKVATTEQLMEWIHDFVVECSGGKKMSNTRKKKKKTPTITSFFQKKTKK